MYRFGSQTRPNPDNPRRQQFKLIQDAGEKRFTRSKEQGGTGKKSISRDAFDELGAGMAGMKMCTDLVSHGTWASKRRWRDMGRNMKDEETAWAARGGPWQEQDRHQDEGE
eukprot:9488986-Pyramimonas_sp.AAC.2